MRILGLPVPFTSTGRAPAAEEKALVPVDHRQGLWGVIYEAFAGAWQQNVEIRTEDILRHPAVQAALALISGDVAKLRLRLVQRGTGNTWTEVRNPANPIFTKPNHYQTRVQFFEQWVLSLLIWGNVYVLKERNRQGQVVAYFILDPRNVRVLVSETGIVFYQLARDNLSDVEQEVAVPASEIIHDRYKPKYHPLVGVAPIEACALAAAQGMSIQRNSTLFFRNGSRPGGILTAEGPIKKEVADRLKAAWDNNYTGDNTGKVAVLGDGLKYQSMEVTAQNSQAVEQLKLTNEMVAMAFNLPLWKIGAGPMPSVANVQAGEIIYYSQCLQTILENIEALLDDGLGMGQDIGVEFDTDGLLRMDTAGQMEALDKGKNIMTPDEARQRLNLAPTSGGDVVYRQQQDYSLAALAKRDAREDPFASGGGAAATTPAGEPVADIQATAFNGAQVTALLDIIAAVTGGQMPLESARAAIAAAFPSLTPAQIDAIVAPLLGFTPSNDNEGEEGNEGGERSTSAALAELRRGLA